MHISDFSTLNPRPVSWRSDNPTKRVWYMGVALDTEVQYGLPKGVFMGARAPTYIPKKNLDRKILSSYFFIYI